MALLSPAVAPPASWKISVGSEILRIQDCPAPESTVGFGHAITKEAPETR
jgi:hypothetical protein